MKANGKSQIKIIIALGIFFALLLMSQDYCLDNSDDTNLDKKIIKISTLSGRIHIDGNDPSSNWSVAKDAGICTGYGTYSNPYVIKDLEIDGGDSGSCISIENSGAYFRIENCTVYNSGVNYSSYVAGIRLYNANNGELIDNQCFSNQHGIYLLLSNDINILGNTVNNNHDIGIWLYYTDTAIIIDNECSSNQGGIELFHSNNINVLRNTANLNEGCGILSFCTGNGKLTDNECSSNQYGIWVGNGDDSTILGNTANNNHDSGIFIKSSDHSTISGNIANFNDKYGIYSRNCDYSTVSGNIANYNNQSGISLTSNEWNTITENNVNNNTDSGIRLFCSDKNIISDNTIMGNAYGIYLYDSDCWCGACDSNEIYGNAFSDNGEDIYSTTDDIDNTFPIEPLFNLIISIISLVIAGSMIIGVIVFRSRIKH